MEKSISEQMDDMRQKTKDAYVRGIGTPESEVEQRADNSRVMPCGEAFDPLRHCELCIKRLSCPVSLCIRTA